MIRRATIERITKIRMVNHRAECLAPVPALLRT
jgi:hypothetical protein